MIPPDIRQAVERRLAEIEAEAVHLRALVALYGGAASAVGTDTPAAARQPRALRAKLPSDALPFLRFMAERQDPVHMDELETFAKERGITFDRSRMRAHMHNLKKREMASNPAQSMFALTQAGRDVVLADAEHDHEDAGHDDAPKRNEAPNGHARSASETGEAQDAPTSASLWSQP